MTEPAEHGEPMIHHKATIAKSLWCEIRAYHDGYMEVEWIPATPPGGLKGVIWKKYVKERNKVMLDLAKITQSTVMVVDGRHPTIFYPNGRIERTTLGDVNGVNRSGSIH